MGLATLGHIRERFLAKNAIGHGLDLAPDVAIGAVFIASGRVIYAFDGRRASIKDLDCFAKRYPIRRTGELVTAAPSTIRTDETRASKNYQKLVQIVWRNTLSPGNIGARDRTLGKVLGQIIQCTQSVFSTTGNFHRINLTHSSGRAAILR